MYEVYVMGGGGSSCVYCVLEKGKTMVMLN